eukprot:1196000-Prorocentrum_minimum.AAC.3
MCNRRLRERQVRLLCDTCVTLDSLLCDTCVTAACVNGRCAPVLRGDGGGGSGGTPPRSSDSRHLRAAFPCRRTPSMASVLPLDGFLDGLFHLAESVFLVRYGTKTHHFCEKYEEAQHGLRASIGRLPGRPLPHRRERPPGARKRIINMFSFVERTSLMFSDE